MAVYSPQSLGINVSGYGNGAWIQGRQLWNGTLSDPGVIHPSSNQQGAGQLVSKEVNAQSALKMGKTAQEVEDYLNQQRKLAQQRQVQPTQTAPTSYAPTSSFNPTFEDTSGGITPGSLTEAFKAQPSINLPQIYESLYKDSGISDKQTQITNLEKQYLEARNKISDNPFLNASMIDQRLQRLQNKYESEVNPIKNEIAMKQADIETQLNLQTKQFDINSEQAKNSLAFFNTLLDMGALNNADGSAIAELTRSTGLNSSIIQSAITANKKKNQDLYIDTFTADSGEVTVVTIDKGTGSIVNQQSLGLIGNAQGTGGGGTATERRESDYQTNRSTLIGDIQRGALLRDLVGHYGGVIDVAEIYQLYNSSSPYGNANESLEEVQQGRFSS